MKIHQKSKGVDRQDAFWYDGDIAETHDYVLVATGDVRVIAGTAKKAQYLKDHRAREYAIDRNWGDKDLGRFVWERNNWFEILFIERTTERGAPYDTIPGGEGGVYHEYDEAIEELKKLESGVLTQTK